MGGIKTPLQMACPYLQASDGQTMTLSKSHSTSETGVGDINKADLNSSRSDMETAALAEEHPLPDPLIKSLMCVCSL